VYPFRQDSTGAFAVPFEWAIPIAVGAVFDYLDESPETNLEIVRHVVYSRENDVVEPSYRREIEGQIANRAKRSPQ